MKMLITGGAGFIGVNAAEYFMKKGYSVFIFDNMSRKGCDHNLEWLKSNYTDSVYFVKGDITESEELCECFKKHGPFTHILHLAAQVAVTISINDPVQDFQINALGSLNLLETTRNFSKDASIIYASTNKVYGHLPGVCIKELESRYEFADFPKGIEESHPLNFHSPYGCSKGAADQYFLDYARIYGLKAVSFRQSCIYGKRQFGIEDQGWVAWFTIAAEFKKKITIYGNGKQVRDVLYISDLLDAYDKAFENIQSSMGEAYNIGGGNFNMSLLELIDFLEEFTSTKLNLIYGEWREGDQKVFVSDIRKAKRKFGWEPKIDVKNGVGTLAAWVNSNKKLLGTVLQHK